ncbi:MAG: PEP-CTERM sorting domain-containing protein [Thermodesulfobacteriota bacterium]|jgi:hypothetical protein
MKKILVSVFAIILGLSTSVWADSFSYTTLPGDSGPGAGITYELNVTENAATLILSGSTSSLDTWYMGWITIKLDKNNGLWDITSPPPSLWSISDVNQNTAVQVLTGGGNHGNLREDGAAGFYVTSLAQGNTPDITQGILLTGGPISGSFSFTFTVPNGVKADNIPFQVGYYDGLTGKGEVEVNQLSKNLTVPEPGILILLGIAMSAIGMASWRIRKI